MKTFIGAALATMTLASAAGAQSLESRIDHARGTLAFEFAARGNVCGNGQSITISDDTSPGWTTRSRRSGMQIGRMVGGEPSRCELAPVRVVVDRGDAKALAVRVTVGGAREHVDTELGAVSAPEGARYLLALAPALNGRSADNAIMGAAIADSVVTWRRMLEIARSNGATESARKATLFWVSQQAGEVATAGLGSVAEDDQATIAVRSDALFFLSQRPHGEGVPGLIKVVQESKSAKLRKDAMWFLSQGKDPRALDLFERILSGK